MSTESKEAFERAREGLEDAVYRWAELGATEQVVLDEVKYAFESAVEDRTGEV